MSQQFDPYEPVPDHLADTGPIRRVEDVPGWRRLLGLVSLIAAAGLTIATALLVLTPNESPTPDTIPAPTVANTAAPTQAPPTAPEQSNPTDSVAIPGGIPPTLSVDSMAQLLATPVAPIDQLTGWEIPRDNYTAFTIIPDRPRSEVIEYTIQSGDTIFQIAERFGLKPESIAWANDRAIVEGLRPGKTLNILPVDGVYFTVQSEQSISSIASRYQVDPYTIIDSEFNPDLFGASPDTELPSGTHVVIPGGVDAAINWNPPVQRVEGTSNSSGGSSGAKISFDVGDPGSCGLVDNPGGGGGWIKPLDSYSWVRGFSSIHSGVDLAAPPGTPIKAANGGTVIFAGWSSWGYGYSVVLAHGPYTTLYGHMSSISARCGSSVYAGQVIGAVGSTGNSTGPHLHFEIRYLDVPTDPTSTIPF